MEDVLAEARAEGREPVRVQLKPLVQHHEERERQLSGTQPAPLVADDVDGGWIVFVSEQSGKPAIHRMRSSAKDHETLTHGELAHYPVGPLPSGDLLAIRVEDPAPDVHLEQLLRIRPTGTIEAFGEPSGRTRSPSIAPGGAWIVYEGDHESFRDLYRRNLASGRVARLTDNPKGNFEPVVSPDGARIAFASSRDGNAEIYVMSADGDQQRRVTDESHSDTAPSWSADGRYLAFVSARDGNPRIHIIETQALDRPGVPAARRLTGDRDLIGEAEITWAPTGSKLALQGIGDRTTSLWVAEVPSGNLRRITDDGALDQGPSWSPSGEHIAFSSNRDGDLDIYRVSSEGGAPVRLTQTPGPDWLPRWIPEPGASAGQPPASDPSSVPSAPADPSASVAPGGTRRARG